MPAIAVPIRPPRPAQLVGIKVLGGQGFPPPAFAALVRTTDDVPEELVLLSLEVPLACALPEGVTKERLERIHAERLISDMARVNPGADWSLMGRGNDPPDFQIRIGADEVGLELTSFAPQVRRTGHAEFRRVRSALLEVGPLGFEHLRGNLVYFWADTQERPASVARSQDRPDIIQGLREFRPIASPLGDDPNEPFPETMPDLGTGTAEPWRFLAVPWEGSHSAAYALLGFDIGVCLESSHSATQARDELVRVVMSHDTSGCDVLAVQVGAPDKNGLIYPTDEVIVDLAVESLRTVGIGTAHIRRLFIHYWGRSAIVEIPITVAS